MQTFCAICNKSFCNSSSFKRHYKNVHEKTNSFLCYISEKVVNRIDNYDRHVRVCKAEFKCFYCDYTFKFSSHRALHVHREHKDKLLFKCDNCCAEFSDERKYQRHQQTCKVQYHILKIVVNENIRYMCRICRNLGGRCRCAGCACAIPILRGEVNSSPHLQKKYIFTFFY